jgi:hypothetical protein
MKDWPVFNDHRGAIFQNIYGLFADASRRVQQCEHFPDQNRQWSLAGWRCNAASQFWMTTISDFSDDVTTGTRKRLPSADTSNPTEECNAALASVPMMNRGDGSAILNLGDSVIGTEYNRPSQAR